jgi:hypothetical protein
MVGGALLGAAANRQVCPTISEMTFGNQSKDPLTLRPQFWRGIKVVNSRFVHHVKVGLLLHFECSIRWN